MSDDTLRQALETVLQNNRDGLTEQAIRQAMLSTLGVRRRPTEIQETLQQNPDRFVALAGGIWRLKAVVQSEEIATGEDDPTLRQERGEPEIPFLATLPRLDAFIAFDLETTGVREARDQIIQIAAVRMSNGQPAGDDEGRPAVFNEYVRLEGRTLAYGLKVKLGFVAHPEWEEALALADALPQVLARFRAWVGELPLVAHNARFDYRFLQVAAAAHNWSIPRERIVDSMELACLLWPEGERLKLEHVASLLGIAAGEPGGTLLESWAQTQGVTDFSWGSFHNAVVDVLVLGAVVPRLTAALRQRCITHPGLGQMIVGLFPDAAASLDIAPPTQPEPLADLIRKLGQRTMRMAGRGREPLASPFHPDQVREQFAAMLTRQGRSIRRSQMQMVETVSQALHDNHFLVVEAPTGTGKTFAYLIPSVLWARSHNQPVVIATHTRLLQEQMKEDLDRVQTSLGVPFQAQVLQGMRNYVCLEQMVAIMSQVDMDRLDGEERFIWLSLFSWLVSTQDGLLEQMPYWVVSTFPLLEQWRNQFRADRQTCSHQTCANCGTCFHYMARQQARQAEVIVMNHALLLAKDWTQEELFFNRVMVDEAHNLENVATDANTIEVSWTSLHYLINRLLNQRTGQGVLIRLRDRWRDADGQRLIAVALDQRRVLKQLVADFGLRLKKYIEQNQGTVDPRYGGKLMLESDPNKANPTSWRPVEEARKRLVYTIRELGTVVRRLHDRLGDAPLPAFTQETRNELFYLADKLAEEAGNLDTLLRVGYDWRVRVHWVEVEPPPETKEDKGTQGNSEELRGTQSIALSPQSYFRWAVKQAPVRVGPYLAGQLYEGKETVVFTSATLRTTHEAGFGFFVDRLGLEDRVRPRDTVALPPELDYSRALFGIARYLPFDARPTEIKQFIDVLQQEFEQFFRFTGGNGLGLFTARERMLKVFEHLEPTLGEQSIPVGCQGETGSRQSLLDELRGRAGSVVLGLRSFWEGVDVPGPNLSYVLMEKLPFPMLGEPIIRARSAEIRQAGGHEFTGYILPLMLIQFKQGFGRLIRDEKDIGAVLLLDKRIWNREYRRDLLAALPGMEETTERAPQLLDDDTLLSRKAVYEAIARHMAQAPPEWQIDLGQLQELLEQVSDDLVTSLEQLLQRLQLADITPLETLNALWDKVLDGLRELFGFADWRVEEQAEAVKAMLSGQDALVVLPTGSGKSLTFQLSALLRNGTTLVFSPLKALMKDQVDKLLEKGKALADRIDSSQPAEEQERVYQRMQEGTTRLVYVAPERIRDPRLMAAIRSAKNIVQVVVDEAHCVHMWGQNFRPDFLYIAQLVETIRQVRGRRPPVAALTATATPRIREAIAQRLHLQPGYQKISRNPNRPELRFVLYNRYSSGFAIKSKRDKLRVLIRILRSADQRNENAIIYVNTTNEAERLARRLEAMALNVRFYHGKMDDQARKDVQDMFIEGQINFIVATKAFGMGVDKSDVRYVIHYQIPGDIESYFQEAGRAGRDGQPSWVILLYHPDDLWVHEQFFIPKSLPEPEQVENVLDWLRRKAQSASGDRFYLDPANLRDDLGFDEENQTGIYLHLLEEAGYLQRELDVTLKASARLLSPLDKLLTHVRTIAEPALCQALAQLLTSQGINTLERRELLLVDGAIALGVSPVALDHLLYQLALQGQVIYRSYARAFTFVPGEKLRGREPVHFDKKMIQRVKREMEQGLQAMKQFAEGRPGVHCLREGVLTYLGEPKPPTSHSECCSLCDIHLRVPWADEPLWEDLLDPGRYHDARYALLQAVAWNEKLSRERGRAPYGIWTLAHLLVGNDYQITRYEQDPQRKKLKQAAIIASEHFGVLEGLEGSVVMDLFDELKQEGFAAMAKRIWDGGGYEYPIPTAQGQERLREGRLFVATAVSDNP